MPFGSFISSAVGAGISSGISGGIGSAISGLFGGGKGSSSKQIKRQIASTQHLRRTHHQDNVYSLRRAGLNPILSATQGPPAGGQAPMAATDSDSQARTSTAQAYLAHTQAENIKKDTELKEAQKHKTVAEAGKVDAEKINIQADTELKKVLKPKTLAEIQLIRQDALKSEAHTFESYASQREIAQRVRNLKVVLKLKDQELKHLLTKYPGLLIEKEIDQTAYAELLRYVNRALPTVNSASGALGAIGIFKKFRGLKKGDHGTWDTKTGEIFGR